MFKNIYSNPDVFFVKSGEKYGRIIIFLYKNYFNSEVFAQDVSKEVTLKCLIQIVLTDAL